jgi:ornithine--oxo-acid transaminase
MQWREEREQRKYRFNCAPPTCLVGRDPAYKAVRGKGLIMGVELGEPESFMLWQAWTLMHKINLGLFAQALTIPLLEKHAVLTQVAGSNQDVLKIAPSLVIAREDID